MSIFVVIPVKRLSEAKMRVAKTLTPTERSGLVLSMFRDVLEAVTQASAVGNVLVISEDDAVLERAHQFKAETLREKTPRGLNSAVKQATDWCITNDAEGVLILPADIPLITSADVTEITSLAKQEPMVVITPSKKEEGTNALLRRPPHIIPTHYGLNSFHSHLREVVARNIPYSIYKSRRIALDIDTIEDLITFCENESKTQTYRFVIEYEIAEKLQIHI